jgi:hypothetical protein
MARFEKNPVIAAKSSSLMASRHNAGRRFTVPVDRAGIEPTAEERALKTALSPIPSNGASSVEKTPLRGLSVLQSGCNSKNHTLDQAFIADQFAGRFVWKNERCQWRHWRRWSAE